MDKQAQVAELANIIQIETANSVAYSKYIAEIVINEGYTRSTPLVANKIDGNTSDGYHTFNELYNHRCLLWINYCLQDTKGCYLVENHFDGWFLLGKETTQGQISYHCPNKYIHLVTNIERRNPEFDGHTSNIVLVRLQDIASITRVKKQETPLVALDKRKLEDVMLDTHRIGANHKEGFDLEVIENYAKEISNKLGSPSARIPTEEQVYDLLTSINKYELYDLNLGMRYIAKAIRKLCEEVNKGE